MSKSIVQKLKYTTPAGSKMELSHCPIHLGIEMLFIALPDDERRAVLAKMKEVAEAAAA